MNKILILTVCCVLFTASGVNGSTKPIKTSIKFTKAVQNCPVSGTATAVLQSGRLEPEIITVPGSAILYADILFAKDLPTDLQLGLTITKLEPVETEVPCLSGVIGSCTYDVCQLLKTNGTEICPIFPPSLPCACPLKSGTYSLTPIPLKVPDLGDIINTLMQGNYKGQALLFPLSSPSNPVGCLEFTFKLTKA